MGEVFGPPLFHMEIHPLLIHSQCARSDEALYVNMYSALARNLPEISAWLPEVAVPVAIVGSGPSVRGQIETIRQVRQDGAPIVAVRDAHDWLIGEGIVPDFAITVDPLPESWHCFEKKNPLVHYLIASQCDPAVFDHLADMRVTIWHPYMKRGQTEPPNKMLIGGGGTSGLRALSLMYVMGFRNFALFGMDSCLDGTTLRVNGTGPKPQDPIIDVQLEPGGEIFKCNLSMAQQASFFQQCYNMLPGAVFKAYGHGLISAIIEKRAQQASELEATTKVEANSRVSFIHAADTSMASYRYRAAIPAAGLGASLNDLSASALIFSKVAPWETIEMAKAKKRGQRIIVDICDDHFESMHYQDALRMADIVTCPTEEMAKQISSYPGFGQSAAVIPDPYEFPLLEPHCHGLNLLWFGHAVNIDGLYRVMPDLAGYPLRIVTNATHDRACPPEALGSRDVTEYAINTRMRDWSLAIMEEEFHKADIVILPKTADYKSANRAVEALRQGCFVVAEPHPALTDIPGIYIGNIKEGIEWVKQQPLPEVSRRISLGQRYVTEKYSPAIVTAQWRSVIQLLTTSDAAESTGKAGSMSMPELMPT